jgi:DNA-directed RNA polymerase subunit E'/Rpb7
VLDLLLANPVTAALPLVVACAGLLLRPPRPARALDAEPGLRHGLPAVGLLAAVGFLVNDSGAAVPALALLVAVPATVAVVARLARRAVRRLDSRAAGRSEPAPSTGAARMVRSAGSPERRRVLRPLPPVRHRWVASSLGKGLTASSLGRLLKARGLRVTMQKLDPYLNVDPGTMNPFQHGEVFVTDDGAETDLDVGHYERFLDEDLHGSANVTTGQVYSAVIAKERRGEYLGDTVQVIPHITDEIKARIRALATDDVDVVITEVGGTVGDIESLPFLEAARQVRQEVGRDRCFFLHVSLIPYIGPSGELKTKPTQHSVQALRTIGITPDALVCRSDRPINESIKRKVANMCDVDLEAVVSCVDAPSIYDIPKVLHSEGLDAYVVRRLGLSFRDVDWKDWDRLLQRVHSPAKQVTVALVGKYVDLPDAYLSVTRPCAPAASPTTPRSRSAGSRRRSASRPRASARRSRASTACSCPAASACAASRASSRPSASPARPACRCSGSASACSAWSSRSPATSPASRRPARRSSTPSAPTRSSRRWPTSTTSSPVSATWAAPCASGCGRPRW